MADPESIVCRSYEAPPGTPCYRETEFGRENMKTFHFMRIEESDGNA